jgi:pSer/pThr/pTyr-binding forkhead associated (FHA) protein
MFRGDGERRSFSIVRDMTVIGRREDCDFRIPLGEISRKHCRLIKDGDSLRIEDLGSSNGTYHNGSKIREAEVQAGDTVEVGSVAFVVQIDGAPAEDELSPVLRQRGEIPLADSDSDHGETVDLAAAEEAAEVETPTAEESGVAVQTSGNGAGNGHGGNGHDAEEFDPMTFLTESGAGAAVEGSGIAPAMMDSHINPTDVESDLDHPPGENAA